jgi:AraC-like DNA-binding protein
MTARANSLTERDTSALATASSSRWFMAATDVRAFLRAFESVGYEAAPLVAAAGVTVADLDDPDARISCEAIGRMVCAAQQTRPTRNLGLALGRVTPIGAFPLLDYLVLTSETVRAAIHQLVRYFRLVGNPVVMEIHEGSDPVRIEVRHGAAPISVEYNAALMVFHLRAETDGPFAAAGVFMRHMPDDAAEWERALGCPVHTGAPWDGVAIPRDVWQLPMRRRDPVLRHVLEARADDVLTRLPARDGLSNDVQRALATRVAGGDTRIESVARQLALSGRTLQRRLAADGVSYHQLLDEARKEAAGRYLTQSPLAIGEVAYLVGYSEPAPFHRAFKRWYGITPEQFRSQIRRSG